MKIELDKEKVYYLGDLTEDEKDKLSINRTDRSCRYLVFRRKKWVVSNYSKKEITNAKELFEPQYEVTMIAEAPKEEVIEMENGSTIKLIDLESVKGFTELKLDFNPKSGHWVDKAYKETSNKPTHYQNNKNIDVIDICKILDLNFNLGNVLKYIARAGKKNGESTLKDLNKALDYIQREIKHLE